MRLKPGQMLTYRDRAYNKTWRVIKIADHPDWVEYCCCYVIKTPPEDSEDLHTVMNLPSYALESRSDWWRGGPH